MKVEVSDCEDQLEIRPLKRDTLKTAITVVFIVLSCGFLLLPLYWKRNWHIACFYKEESHFNAESLVHIKDQFNRHFTVHIKIKQNCSQWSSGWVAKLFSTPQKPTNSIMLFDFKMKKYVISEDGKELRALKPLADDISISEISNTKGGLSSDEQAGRRNLFGLNEIYVPQRSIFILLIQEALHPFYVFQLFSVTVWMFDEYYVYSACIVIMSVVSVTWTLKLARESETKIRKIAQTKEQAYVVRADGTVENVWSTDLVPGDLIEIPNRGCNMAVDAVIIQGTCVVREAALTGESMPVTKLAVPILEKDRPLKEQVDNRYMLFSGTEVMQARNSSNASVQALVVRTNFFTAKGILVRSISFPKPSSLRMYRDATIFIFILASISLIGVLYSLIVLLKNNKPVSMIIVRTLDVITIAIPPALPAALSIGILYALRKLKKAEIFCISPQRINLAGLLDVFCFDKTGTLTEDDISFKSVVPVKENTFMSDMQIKGNEIPQKLLLGLATCHSLTKLDDAIVGDPLELKVFQETEWKFETIDQNEELSTDALCILRSSENAELKSAIVRQFPFISAKQRMGVITRNSCDDKLSFYVKGSAEKVISLCTSSSVPINFNEVLLRFTKQGYRVIVMAHKYLENECIKTVTIDHLEKDLELIALIVLENSIKSETHDVIVKLHAAEIRLVMITGDDVDTAAAVAEQCKLSTNQLKILHNITQYDQYNGDAPLAITGIIFSELDKAGKLKEVINRTNVFARMSPEQKTQLVEELKDAGNMVGMCGDGANDCGALKASHVGISLSELEASAAAPFTSRRIDISCCIDLVAEGRAAMVNSFSTFKYMALYSIIMLSTVELLYWFGTNINNYMFLHIDIMIMFPIILTFCRSDACKNLTPRRPTHELASPLILAQVGVHITLQFLVQFLVVCICTTQFENISVEQIVTVLFITSCYLYVMHAILLSQTNPFRKPLYTNKLFILVIVVNFLASTILLYIDFTWTAELSGLYFFDRALLKNQILLILAGEFVIGWLLEHFIFRKDWTKKKHRQHPIVKLDSVKTL